MLSQLSKETVKTLTLGELVRISRERDVPVSTLLREVGL